MYSSIDDPRRVPGGILAKLFLISWGLLAISGCGSDHVPSPKGIVVTLSQSAATVDINTTLQLTATVQNDAKGSGVTWTLSGPGALSSQTATSVTYTGPNAPGSATVTATAVADSSKSANVAVSIVPPPSITTPPQFPPVTLGQPYSLQLTETGGTPPFTWSIVQGQLLPGLTLDSRTGLISGTVNLPPAGSIPAGRVHSSASGAAPPGPGPGPNDHCFQVLPTFGVGIQDSATPTNKGTLIGVFGFPPGSLTIQLLPGPTMPRGKVGTQYSASFSSSGGFCPIQYGVNSGALPDGITLDATNEAFSGIPQRAGLFDNLIMVASDGSSPTLNASVHLSIRIIAAIVINTTSLPSGALNNSYNQTLSANEGFPGDGVAFSLASNSGPLPDGLTLSSAGNITGTPTKTGTFPFAVCAFDPVDPQPGSTCGNSANTATQNLSITINSTPQPDFSLAASPVSLTVADGGKASTTVTVAAFGGFSDNVTLSASGQPTGVTTSFNPPTVNGAGSSTLTFTADSNAPPTNGSVPITISGTTMSGITRTTLVSLTVSKTPPPSNTGVNLISQSTTGTQGNLASTSPSTNVDGSLIAFGSEANNLTADNVGTRVSNIFLHRTCNTANCVAPTILVSQVDPSFSSPPDGDSQFPSINAAGAFVAFESTAKHLVAGGTKISTTHIFRRKVCIDPGPGCTEKTDLMSVNNNGDEGNDRSHSSSISANGRFVAFASAATNLDVNVPVTNSTENIFVRDTCFEAGADSPAFTPCTPGTRLVSMNTNGALASAISSAPSVSADGSLVAFASAATNLDPGATDGRNHVYLCDTRDLPPKVNCSRIILVSTGFADATPRVSENPAVSADARYVAFDATISNGGPANSQVFVRDTCEGRAAPQTCTPATQPVSAPFNGTPDGNSFLQSISADGRFIAYFSQASGQDADNNLFGNVFVRDTCVGQDPNVCQPKTVRVSKRSDGTLGNGVSGQDGLSIAGNGQEVAFASDATNLVDNDTNNATDVFEAGSGFVQPALTPASFGVGPSSANHGAGDALLALVGDGFLPGAQAMWNGSPRDTTYIDSKILAMFIPAADLAAAGSAQITVVNPPPGGTSAPVTFTIK